MYSAADLHIGGVSPFGYLRINDRSHLPAAFRSVPRPSSPLGAKASTERPCLTHHPTTNTPARSTKPRNKPMIADSKHYAYQTTLHFHSQIHLSKITRQDQVQRPRPTCGGFGSTRPSRPQGRGTPIGLTATALRGKAAQVAP